jgi:hypothetical protein
MLKDRVLLPNILRLAQKGKIDLAVRLPNKITARRTPSKLSSLLFLKADKIHPVDENDFEHKSNIDEIIDNLKDSKMVEDDYFYHPSNLLPKITDFHEFTFQDIVFIDKQALIDLEVLGKAVIHGFVSPTVTKQSIYSYFQARKINLQDIDFKDLSLDEIILQLPHAQFPIDDINRFEESCQFNPEISRDQPTLAFPYSKSIAFYPDKYSSSLIFPVIKQFYPVTTSRLLRFMKDAYGITRPEESKNSLTPDYGWLLFKSSTLISSEIKNSLQNIGYYIELISYIEKWIPAEANNINIDVTIEDLYIHESDFRSINEITKNINNEKSFKKYGSLEMSDFNEEWLHYVDFENTNQKKIWNLIYDNIVLTEFARRLIKSESTNKTTKAKLYEHLLSETSDISMNLSKNELFNELRTKLGKNYCNLEDETIIRFILNSTTKEKSYYDLINSKKTPKSIKKHESK